MNIRPILGLHMLRQFRRSFRAHISETINIIIFHLNLCVFHSSVILVSEIVDKVDIDISNVRIQS